MNEQAIRADERRASFELFNDAMNEFVANMKVDPASARETMKRRMLDAMNGATRGPLPSLAALQRLLAWRDAMSEDDARYPAADPGCPVCTAGTTPTRYQTGLCAWHQAERVVREAQTDTRARSEKERT